MRNAVAYMNAMSTSVDRGQTLTNVAQILGSRSSGSVQGGHSSPIGSDDYLS
jgi:hypothetical protein